MAVPLARTRRVAEKTRRRHAASLLIDAAGVALAGGSAIGLAGVLVARALPIARLDPHWPWLIAAPVLASVVVLGMATLARRWTPLRSAQEVDRRLALRDRLGTAIELADRPAPGIEPAFVALAAQDAERVAAEASPARAVPIAMNRWWRAGGVLALLAVSAGLWMPPLDLVERQARVRERSRRAIEARESIGEAKALVREAVGESAPIADAASAPELEAIEEIERELAAGRTTPEQARVESARRIQELASRLEARSQEERARRESVREALTLAKPGPGEDQGPASDVAEALREGDLSAAAHAAEQLARDLPRMPAEQRRQVAEELRRLSEALESQRRAEPAADPSPGAEGPMPSQPPAGDRAPEPGEPPPPAPTDDVERLRESLENAARELERERSSVADEPKPPEPPAEPGKTDPATAAEQPPGKPPQDPRGPAPEQPKPTESGERPGSTPPKPGEIGKEGADRSPTPPAEPGGEPKRGADPPPPGEPARSEQGARPGEQPKTDESKPAPAQPGAKPGEQPAPPSDRQQPGPPPPAEGQKGQEVPSSHPDRQPGSDPRPTSDPAAQPREPGLERPGETPRPGAQPPQPGQPAAEPRPTGQERPPGEQPRPGAAPRPEPSPSPTGTDRQPPKERPDQPGRVDVPRTEPGAEPGKAPEPAETPGEGQLPDKLDEKAIERLAEQLRRLERMDESARRRLSESQALREQAEKMLRQMSPRDRQQLEELAERWGGDPTGSGDQRVDRPPTREWTGPTEAVDARPRGEAAKGARESVISEWLAPATPGPDTAARREATAERFREAARGAERAVEQQAVPMQHRDLVRRVFNRYTERATKGQEPR